MGNKITKEGYEQLAKAISTKEQEILDKSVQMSDYFCEETGSDTISQAFTVAQNELIILKNEQLRMEKDLIEAEIIEVEDFGMETVSIGDTFTLESLNEEDKGETETYTLTAQLTSLLDDLGNTITINCDMGKAVLGRKIGDKIAYEVKDPRGLYNATYTYKIIGLEKAKKSEQKDDQKAEEQGQKKQIVLPGPIQKA